MRALAAIVCALVLAQPAAAQVLPALELDNPRLQTVPYTEGQEVLLTVMPSSGLTVMLERGEQIERIIASDDDNFDVRVSPEGNTFLILPQSQNALGRMLVESDRRSYTFALRVDRGLTAAYLVQFTYDGPPSTVPDYPTGEHWSYRVRGDDIVRPQAIRDDARRTYITYGQTQPLPAVFAIGPTGEEEVVNGYMREGTYVIDRVYAELIFRIDDERATARRNSEPDNAG